MHWVRCYGLHMFFVVVTDDDLLTHKQTMILASRMVFIKSQGSVVTLFR